MICAISVIVKLVYILLSCICVQTLADYCPFWHFKGSFKLARSVN